MDSQECEGAILEIQGSQSFPVSCYLSHLLVISSQRPLKSWESSLDHSESLQSRSNTLLTVALRRISRVLKAFLIS